MCHAPCPPFSGASYFEGKRWQALRMWALHAALHYSKQPACSPMAAGSGEAAAAAPVAPFSGVSAGDTLARAAHAARQPLNCPASSLCASARAHAHAPLGFAPERHLPAARLHAAAKGVAGRKGGPGVSTDGWVEGRGAGRRGGWMEGRRLAGGPRVYYGRLGCSLGCMGLPLGQLGGGGVGCAACCLLLQQASDIYRPAPRCAPICGGDETGRGLPGVDRLKTPLRFDPRGWFR